MHRSKAAMIVSGILTATLVVSVPIIFSACSPFKTEAPGTQQSSTKSDVQQNSTKQPETQQSAAQPEDTRQKGTGTAETTGTAQTTQTTGTAGTTQPNANGALPASSPALTETADKLQQAEDAYAAGNELYNSGEYEKAAEMLSRAVKLNPSHAEAYNVLGVCLAFLGQYEEAMNNLNRAVELDNRFAHAYFNRAICWKLQKKYDEAIKDFDIAISLNPRDVWAHYGKATIYSERGDVANCISSLKIALERDASVKEAVRTEEEFDNVRKDPAFLKLMGE